MPEASTIGVPLPSNLPKVRRYLRGVYTYGVLIDKIKIKQAGEPHVPANHLIRHFWTRTSELGISCQITYLGLHLRHS